jgi:ssDNA-binding Zn-finger/Zn-ribbon topoisomerase 1
MGFNDGLVYHNPPKHTIVERQLVEGQRCPECGSEDVRRYPVGWVRGPRIVVKCQHCFHALSVERPTREDAWPPFRSATYDWDVSPSERAGAARGRP